MKWLVIAVLIVGCGGGGGCGDKYPVAQLEDPNTCKTCHPKHYDQWSGSMHAYASEDPVFVAMNKRGQREAQLGTFCVQCHAPMAVKLGLTDGVNYDPASLPPEAKGITCYFCHNVDSVTADHNNGLVLAMDQTMRGGAKNPVDTPAHDSVYDGALMAGYNTKNNSMMCGSCHDIVTPGGVHIERSFEEWKGTIFAFQDPQSRVTCAGCHMKPSDGVIADNPSLSVISRMSGFHAHTFPAVDQAFTAFPNTDVQLAGIQDILDPSIAIRGPAPAGGGTPPGGICVDPTAGGTLSIRMDTFSTGHMFPSGAAQDRRVWLEVIAYDASNNVVFSSGVVGDNQDPEDINDDYVNCVDAANFKCTGFWDRTTKSDGTRAHFFWDVANEESHVLKPAVTLLPNDPLFDHSTTAKWSVAGVFSQIDHITARIRTRAFPYAVLDELVASGDLDPMYAQSLKTLQGAGGTRTWDKATKGTGSAINTNCNPETP